MEQPDNSKPHNKARNARRLDPRACRLLRRPNFKPPAPRGVSDSKIPVSGAALKKCRLSPRGSPNNVQDPSGNRSNRRSTSSS